MQPATKPEQPITDAQIRDHILRVIMERFSLSDHSRQEALHDVLSLSVSGLDKAELTDLARIIPAIPATVYEKWVTLFADRLLETIPRNILHELCLETEESRATLALTFIMFMESKRMEEVTATDIKELGISLSSNDTVTHVGVWLREYMNASRN